MAETKTKSVQELLSTIQSELKAPKGQYNAFGKYKYRSCEDILEAVKPLLKKTGLFLTMTDEVVEIGGRIYVKANVTISSADGSSFTVSAYAREDETKKGMDGAQITGAASSYARKYALCGLFAIDDNRDADSAPQETKSVSTPNDDPEIKGLKEEFNAICKNHKLNGAAVLKTFNINVKDLNKDMLTALNKKLTEFLADVESGNGELPKEWRV